MKVHISVDMEGIACVTHGDHTKLEGVEYEMARKWMTAEVNAAEEGALECGATEIVVADSHGHMRNLLPDELNEKVLLVRGSPRRLTMMEGIDSSFDASFMIGYHSMAGTHHGILAHTYLGRSVYALRLNGLTVGEPGFNAAIAGHFGVPVALVTGDDTLAAEVNNIMPATEQTIVKWVISNNAAKNLTPKESQRKIKAGAVNALKRLKEIKPFMVETPVKFDVDFMLPISADIASDIPGVELVNGRTLSYVGKDMLDVVKIWRLIINASLTAFAI